MSKDTRSLLENATYQFGGISSKPVWRKTLSYDHIILMIILIIDDNHMQNTSYNMAGPFELNFN